MSKNKNVKIIFKVNGREVGSVDSNKTNLPALQPEEWDFELRKFVPVNPNSQVTSDPDEKSE